ncbi:hypothetical protein E4665_14660 [Sporolactobacillus shoreae]|uniref:Bacterial Ig-like domain-containing protein n=1 Tax=Sporolactobacillus shoreae TaxID=1465501 RepID=A0A4Z0GKM5_9BACL|nr:immunoglobulin-like domain-containing protein [Sporolactobacillus shoreae]TGA96647.1 hypothetical protein E4665_14660 [Sporolactobacillus shoreae]
MKQIIGSILLTVAVMILSGCGHSLLNPSPNIASSGKGGSEPEYSKLKLTDYKTDKMNQNANIVLTVGTKFIPTGSTSITVTIENKTNHKIGYGALYQIETMENGKWYQLPFRKDVSFSLIYKNLNPLQSDRAMVSITTDTLQFPLKKGKYRIVKEIDQQIFSAEFELL